jgi:hypothetical protein
VEQFVSLEEEKYETINIGRLKDFLMPNGLPKLVIIDGGSEFKSALIEMCDQIGISYYVVPPKAHNAILCKHFH